MLLKHRFFIYETFFESWIRHIIMLRLQKMSFAYY